VLTRASVAEAKGYAPVAVLKGVAAHAHDPKLFTTAPVGAVQKVLAAAGWSVADVDLFEINEAFACVAMFAIHDLGLDHAKVNVNGGATAGPPDRLLGRAHSRHADRGAEGARAEEGRRLAVHRRRRGGGRGGGTALIAARFLPPAAGAQRPLPAAGCGTLQLIAKVLLKPRRFERKGGAARSSSPRPFPCPAK
jgi:hypothetical protein